MSEEEVSKLNSLLSSSKNVVICAHKSPDGDAIGASLAWANFLKSIGCHTSIVMPYASPDFLHWLPSFSDVVRFDKSKETVTQIFSNADLVCCLDFNETSRTYDLQETLDNCSAPKFLIDHHLNPNMEAVLKLSFPDKCSTCEIVFSLIWQLGGYETMTQDCATCLYCGMMTDTGGFTYNSTRPEIYFIISQLLAKGINKDDIYNKVYHNYSVHCLRFRSYIMLKKLKYMEELHACYYSVSKEEMKDYHFKKGDLEGLVNEPLKIKGLKLSISFREDTEKPGLILVSLRSTNGFHCRDMAAQFFNGGGHADAAGGKLINSTLEEAETIALRALLAYKNELHG